MAESSHRKNNPCRLPWTEKVLASVKNSETLELDEDCLHKRLYVCTSEKGATYPSYKVHAIKLGDLLEDKSELYEAASDSGSHLPAFAGCGLFGSYIVFAGGCRILGYGALERSCSKDLYLFDTQDVAGAFTKMDSSFIEGKHRPLLVEVSGKHYALSGKPVFEPAPATPAFEVFDPSLNNWTALLDPPILDFDSPDFKFVPISYIISGSKIYVSTREMGVIKEDWGAIGWIPAADGKRHWQREKARLLKRLMGDEDMEEDEEWDDDLEEDADDELIEELIHPEVEQLLAQEEKKGNCDVYCFDVTNVDLRWRKISNFFWIKRESLLTPMDTTPFHGRALSMDFNLGEDLRLVFTYEFDQKINFFVMSEERAVLFHSLKLVLPAEFSNATEYNFVKLGDRKVGLVLSRFPKEYVAGKMNVVLVPFAFEYWDDWFWFVRFTIMPCQVLEYYTEEGCSNYPEVLGCFVL